jgi:hypothetical protein
MYENVFVMIDAFWNKKFRFFKSINFLTEKFLYSDTLTKCSKEGIEAPGQAGSCSSLEPVL